MLLQFQGPGIVHAGSLSRCHGLLGHLNETELSLKPVTPFPTMTTAVSEITTYLRYSALHLLSNQTEATTKLGKQ